MRIIKLIASFIIFYFIVTAFNGMIQLAKWISLGNKWIEIGFYIFIILLFIIYVIFPLLSYFSKPSLKEVEGALNGDKKAIKKIHYYLLRNVDVEERVKLQSYSIDQCQEIQGFIRNYIKKQSNELDRIIQRYALKLTVTVMISPNSFIDGISILFGNSQMIYALTKTIGFRFSVKDLFKMYFSVMTMASVSGIIEEFDEVIEEIIEEVAEEFSEYMTEESTKSISDLVPFFNVAMKTLSPIVQGASNYGFIVYNGNRFKYMVLNVMNTDKLSEKEIQRLSRRDARKVKYDYIRDMLKKVGVNNVIKVKEVGLSSYDKVKEASVSSVDKIKAVSSNSVTKVKEVGQNGVDKVKDMDINSVHKVKKRVKDLFN